MLMRIKIKKKKEKSYIAYSISNLWLYEYNNTHTVDYYPLSFIASSQRKSVTSDLNVSVLGAILMLYGSLFQICVTL